MEAKAENDRLAAIEADLSKGDKAKFETLIEYLATAKGIYEFKSKKHNALSVEVNTLIDKIINHIKIKA